MQTDAIVRTEQLISVMVAQFFWVMMAIIVNDEMAIIINKDMTKDMIETNIE